MSFPLWFSAFLLSKGSGITLPSSISTTIPSTLSPTATIPSSFPSTIIATTASTTFPSTSTASSMTNYILPQQPTSAPIEIMDRKKKKPVMEKQRRDRMNKALEDLKVIIIRHDPNHTSKLEKADILEKTLELVRFFEFQLSQIQHQTTAQTIGTIFDGLSRNKSSPEIIKSVRDVVISLFPPPPQLRQQQQQIIPSSSIPAMPTFNQLSRIPTPMHPIFFQAATNPLLLPQRLPPQQQQQHFLPQFNPAQNSSAAAAVMLHQHQTAPKSSSAPVMTPPFSSSSSSTTTTPSATATTTTQSKSESNSSPSKTYETESRSNSRAETENSSGDDDEDDADGEDDLIDVVNIDNKHDETFSPPTTPNKHHLPQIQSRKRSRNSFNATSEGDDSGIFDGPSPPKKSCGRTTFSIDGILK